MSSVQSRLNALGITLPDAVAPVANYVPFVITGNLVVISGQISMDNGTLIAGTLGHDMDVEAGVRAARVCGLNLVAQLHAACASVDKTLDHVSRVVRLGGFVASTPDFTDQPKVINGASDMMVEIFGDAGRHARAAVGVPSLPLGAAVEIDAMVEIAG
ncbi:MAG: RidA family protein [Pseudomonadota bacterium]